jgi:hypothetical protein
MGICDFKHEDGTLCERETVWNDACEYHQFDDDDYEDECVELELADTAISLSLSEDEIKILRSADFPVELALKIANAILDAKG